MFYTKDDTELLPYAKCKPFFFFFSTILSKGDNLNSDMSDFW